MHFDVLWAAYWALVEYEPLFIVARSLLLSVSLKRECETLVVYVLFLVGCAVEITVKAAQRIYHFFQDSQPRVLFLV